MILIITNKEDEHPTPVIETLIKRNIPVFRLNTECLLTDYEFTWWNTSGLSRFIIKNKQTGLTLDIEDLTAVWDRRPKLPKELPFKVSEAINKHNLKEAAGFLRFLRSYITSTPSIGSILYDEYASSKMEQLQYAEFIGLKVPDTVFTNRQEDIIAMARNHQEIVLKSIASDGIMDDCKGTEYVFYSQ